jgi:AraC-like DNA-binding protein
MHVAALWGCWDKPADIPFLSGLIQREIIYRILQAPAGARLRAIATLGDQSNRTAKAIACGGLEPRLTDPLMDGLDAASAAFEVGYESASQFNREYSRFFGQPPMRDIRTLRSPSAPALESVQ